MAAKVTVKDVLGSENPAEVVKKLNFEDGLRVLDELVNSVEQGATPLEQAVVSYERGVQLLAHLKSLLSGAEEKLKVLQKPA